jgi:putative Holliday junction resolvase
MRYLAVDLGNARTGLAVGDDVTKIVSPLTVLEIPRQSPRLLDAIVEAIGQQQPDAIVLGITIERDGTEGPQAKPAREFAAALSNRLPELVIHFQDERLTSYAADQRMARTGRTRREKKQLRDALAAAEILRDFLEARR